MVEIVIVPDAAEGHPDQRDASVDGGKHGGLDRENERPERPEAATDRDVRAVSVI